MFTTHFQVPSSLKNTEKYWWRYIPRNYWTMTVEILFYFIYFIQRTSEAQIQGACFSFRASWKQKKTYFCSHVFLQNLARAEVHFLQSFKEDMRIKVMMMIFSHLLCCFCSCMCLTSFVIHLGTLRNLWIWRLYQVLFFLFISLFGLEKLFVNDKRGKKSCFSSS